MSIQTTNPATNKVLKSFDEMTDEQVEAAIEKLTSQRNLDDRDCSSRTHASKKRQFALITRNG
jgi:acyl-CoA reductase-like NAD-dependent aldehyde dehydrogenase